MLTKEELVTKLSNNHWIMKYEKKKSKGVGDLMGCLLALHEYEKLMQYILKELD